MDYTVVYDAFLSKITDDEWAEWEESELHRDLRTLLEAAISRFKFPSTSLERNDEGFVNELRHQEIQILATFMKVEWLNRVVLSYENVRALYDERDFSQANLLHRFTVLMRQEERQAKNLEALFYRAEGHVPYDYTKLAGR